MWGKGDIVMIETWFDVPGNWYRNVVDVLSMLADDVFQWFGWEAQFVERKVKMTKYEGEIIEIKYEHYDRNDIH